MLISIDYDGTYTKAPSFWDEFIFNAVHKEGHKVICITNRAFPIDTGRKPLTEILYAGAEYKRTYAEKNGYKVDVWIDDMPETIGKSVELP